MAKNESLKVFLLTAQLIEEDLDAIERDLALDLGRDRVTATGEAADYYPQIEHAFRAEAKAMAPHYEVFASIKTCTINKSVSLLFNLLRPKPRPSVHPINHRLAQLLLSLITSSISHFSF